MAKVIPNNEYQTKSDIFPRSIFKSDINFHSLPNVKIIQRILYLASFNFIAKVSKSNKVK